MSDASDKGNALEQAVRAIEEAIFRSSPQFRPETLLIESKKLLNISGVRHEIDIWVEIAPSTAYRAVFIFECKNRSEKVDKNDIIVFAEKISLAAAQRGFFVARSFTEDALNRAAQDQRITILQASDLSAELLQLPFGFHILYNKPVQIALQVKAVDAQSPRELPENAIFQTAGGPVSSRLYAAQLATDLVNEQATTAVPLSAGAGVYEKSYSKIYEFSVGDLVVEGHSIKRLQLDVKCEHHVIHPRVVSRYDVETRGRIHMLESAELSGIGFVSGALIEHTMMNNDGPGLEITLDVQTKRGV